MASWAGAHIIVRTRQSCFGLPRPKHFKTEFDFSTQIGWLHLPSPLDVVKVRLSHLDKRFFSFHSKKNVSHLFGHMQRNWCWFVMLERASAVTSERGSAVGFSTLRALKQNFRKCNSCLKHVTFRDHIIFSSKIFCGNEWCCAWYGQIVVYEALVPAWWNSKVVLAFAVARRGPDWLKPTSPKMEYKFINIVMGVSIGLVRGGCWAHFRGENIS